ncbi:hypothetical protein GMRT_11438 [Giardia muris]|uniref:Uncharacterized protein n=1 Tax=Giardia muris TaxID=5742 RepID=A0A4Z1TB37_GIAMU|nr:hypothetical protein GMRT_11438 [Giardia muris]|eukprot:TNJ29741.1 hypothetical protein GMRT_11438 [Giardia muris]
MPGCVLYSSAPADVSNGTEHLSEEEILGLLEAHVDELVAVAKSLPIRIPITGISHQTSVSSFLLEREILVEDRSPTPEPLYIQHYDRLFCYTCYVRRPPSILPKLRNAPVTGERPMPTEAGDTLSKSTETLHVLVDMVKSLMVCLDTGPTSLPDMLSRMSEQAGAASLSVFLLLQLYRVIAIERALSGLDSHQSSEMKEFHTVLRSVIDINSERLLQASEASFSLRCFLTSFVFQALRLLLEMSSYLVFPAEISVARIFSIHAQTFSKVVCTITTEGEDLLSDAEQRLAHLVFASVDSVYRYIGRVEALDRGTTLLTDPEVIGRYAFLALTCLSSPRASGEIQSLSTRLLEVTLDVPSLYLGFCGFLSRNDPDSMIHELFCLATDEVMQPKGASSRIERFLNDIICTSVTDGSSLRPDPKSVSLVKLLARILTCSKGSACTDLFPFVHVLEVGLDLSMTRQKGAQGTLVSILYFYLLYMTEQPLRHQRIITSFINAFARAAGLVPPHPPIETNKLKVLLDLSTILFVRTLQVASPERCALLSFLPGAYLRLFMMTTNVGLQAHILGLSRSLLKLLPRLEAIIAEGKTYIGQDEDYLSTTEASLPSTEVPISPMTCRANLISKSKEALMTLVMDLTIHCIISEGIGKTLLDTALTALTDLIRQRHGEFARDRQLLAHLQKLLRTVTSNATIKEIIGLFFTVLEEGFISALEVPEANTLISLYTTTLATVISVALYSRDGTRRDSTMNTLMTSLGASASTSSWTSELPPRLGLIMSLAMQSPHRLRSFIRASVTLSSTSPIMYTVLLETLRLTIQLCSALSGTITTEALERIPTPIITSIWSGLITAGIILLEELPQQFLIDAYVLGQNEPPRKRGVLRHGSLMRQIHYHMALAGHIIGSLISSTNSDGSSQIKHPDLCLSLFNPLLQLLTRCAGSHVYESVHYSSTNGTVRGFPTLSDLLLSRRKIVDELLRISLDPRLSSAEPALICIYTYALQESRYQDELMALPVFCSLVREQYAAVQPGSQDARVLVAGLYRVSTLARCIHEDLADERFCSMLKQTLEAMPHFSALTGLVLQQQTQLLDLYESHVDSQRQAIICLCVLLKGLPAFFTSEAQNYGRMKTILEGASHDMTLHSSLLELFVTVIQKFCVSSRSQHTTTSGNSLKNTSRRVDHHLTGQKEYLHCTLGAMKNVVLSFKFRYSWKRVGASRTSSRTLSNLIEYMSLVVNSKLVLPSEIIPDLYVILLSALTDDSGALLFPLVLLDASDLLTTCVQTYSPLQCVRSLGQALKTMFLSSEETDTVIEGIHQYESCRRLLEHLRPNDTVLGLLLERLQAGGRRGASHMEITRALVQQLCNLLDLILQEAGTETTVGQVRRCLALNYVTYFLLWLWTSSTSHIEVSPIFDLYSTQHCGLVDNEYSSTSSQDREKATYAACCCLINEALEAETKPATVLEELANILALLLCNDPKLWKRLQKLYDT